MRQYFVGTSMADMVSDLPKERIRSQEVVGGARVRGSWNGGGAGNFWRLRGSICLLLVWLFWSGVKGRRGLTPGSETEAWTNEEKHK